MLDLQTYVRARLRPEPRSAHVKAVALAAIGIVLGCDDVQCPYGTTEVQQRCVPQPDQTTEGSSSQTSTAMTSNSVGNAVGDGSAPSEQVAPESGVPAGTSGGGSQATGASGSTGSSSDSSSVGMAGQSALPSDQCAGQSSDGTPDGCCPGGADAAANSDCLSECGNGLIEPGETCDPPGSCPVIESCVAMDSCLAPTLVGDADSCTAACEFASIAECTTGDSCCPDGCDYGTDQDCSQACGDGVVTPPETCEENSDTPCPSSCDDGNECTSDVKTGSAQQCNTTCTHSPIGTGEANGCGGCQQLEHESGEPCSAGSGACIGTGSYQCQGPNEAVCNAKPKTEAETCDRSDNDCDGMIDEGVTNSCGGCARLQHDEGDRCTAGSGSCQGTGAYRCQGKDSVACDARPDTSPESCDGVDNDCDGQVDEDTGTGGSCRPANGCGAGAYVCRSGAVVCDAPATEMEACGNDVDDDCDGVIDEVATGQGNPPAWFLDCDGDGGGNAEIATNSCRRPADVKGCRFVSRVGSDPPQAECACLQ